MTVSLSTFSDIMKEYWLGPAKVKFKFRTGWSCSQHTTPQSHYIYFTTCGCPECEYHEDQKRIWDCEECAKAEYKTDKTTMEAVYISTMEEQMNSELLFLKRFEAL